MKKTKLTQAVDALSGWVEIFIGGTQTPSNGQTAEFGEGFLDEVIANHVPVPHVIGHPDDTAPAYGWTSDLKRDGLKLLAKSTDINPDFAAAVVNKSYPDRSSSFKKTDDGWQLRHVGWLGGVAPAIKGLQPAFAEADDADVIEFTQVAPKWATASGISRAASLFQRVRDWMIATDGLEAANKILPTWEIEHLAETGTSIQTSGINITPNPPPTDNQFSETQGDTPVPRSYTEAEIAQIQADAAEAARTATTAEFSEQLTTAQQQLAAQASAQRVKDNQVAIDGWVAEGKLLPAHVAGLPEFMASLDETDVIEFSEVDGKTTTKKPQSVMFADFVAALPKQIKLGKRQAGDDVTDGKDITPEQIREFAEAQGISFTAAAHKLAEQA